MRRRSLLSSSSGGGGTAEGHDFIEIGGVKWATTNIGAETETDPGLYFQWGDTAGYTSGQCGSSGTTRAKPFYYADYKFNGGRTTFNTSGMTKYNTVDGKTVLELSDDAARLYWGGDWRMPTKEEFAALSAATIFIDSSGTEIASSDKRTTLSGVTGIYLQDNTDPNKRLFFPAAGYCSNGLFDNNGDGDGFYLSSSLSTDVTDCYGMSFSSLGVNWQFNDERVYGDSVRPVLDL